MKKIGVFVFGIIALASCTKEKFGQTLEDYLAENAGLERTDLIACAAGSEEEWDSEGTYPTSVFFYPIEGASDFRYFETKKLKDSLDFSTYRQKELTDDPVFNGYLWKFNNTEFKGERMGIVTYKTPGKMHVCKPIRLKTNEKPTEQTTQVLTITENGVTPMFEWMDGITPENAIYFQVISDLNGNLISGTYTFEKNFTFYNLDNVVINIRDIDPAPELEPNTEYRFTLMAVSRDNWVNLVAETTFNTSE